ncbi:MAG TPA: HNH endonuclease [Blastocatellia bacterium]|nr:HNH endonuclease [Blastocatellia bacterium]
MTSATGCTARTKRDMIIERDKGECYLCDAILAANLIVLDHIIPRSRGGTNADNNLAVCCAPCDQRKADNLLSELEWVSSKVKEKYATLKRERTRPTPPNPYHEKLMIFLKRVYLAALALTIATPTRLDDLIKVARRK